ncbi:MAG: glycosyltransferase family 2 protein [Myxococcota bacterium]
MKDSSATYSFVVPIYNDGRLAERFCVEFERVFREYLACEAIEGQVELIFVNDGSVDDSIELLRKLAGNFPFVRVIDLSRNFGQHLALSCGYKHASGDYVGMLNVDQQDPPSQIPKLLDLIRSGDADVVYGLRIQRNDPAINRWTSRLFTQVLNKLTGYDTPLNISTLRVMSRRFVDAYDQLTEKSRYLPGLEMWMGFKKDYTPITHQEREEGTSSYTFRRRLLFALSAIVSFSDLPLKFAVVTGTLVAAVGFLLTAFLILQKLFFLEIQPGYTTTVSLIVFLGGVQILFIGLASLYIGRVLREVQNRPAWIVRDTYNFGSVRESR